jgi:ubiquinone/menaquinone biosynthesis C-methylase UbiE
MPSLELVNKILIEKHNFSREIANKAAKTFGPKWVKDFEELLSNFFPTEEILRQALKGYSAFAMDALKRQRKFEFERAYENKTYAQASAEVYHNEHHMMSQYLPGLLLSHYLWPHHYRQITYFKEFFLSQMKLANASKFCEVGIGTGIFSRITLSEMPNIKGTGFDISQSSKTFTENHLAVFNVSDRYSVELRDVVKNSLDNEFNWLICVEVLEHLEDPVEFLKSLKGMMKEGGKAFITAALNAPNEDHIYLYENTDQVAYHLEEAGFAIEQSFHGLAYKPAKIGLPVPSAAAFIVN